MMIIGSRGFSSVAVVALAILVVFSSWASSKAEESTDEFVLTLTKDNFDEVLSNNDIVLVEFYAPWCGHCKKLAPEYEAAAKQLSEKGSKVKLAKVDATTESELSDKYGVRGYPTLQLFRKKTPEEYNGGRTADTIVEYIEKMTGPAVVYMEDKEFARKLSADKVPTAFIGRFKSKDAELLKAFEAVADISRQAGRFVAHIDASNEDTIHVARLDEDEIKFEGSDEETMKKFIAEESFPLFGPINGENFKQYADRNQDLVWFCGSEKDFSTNKKSVQGAAKQYRKEYSFVWLDTEQFKGHAENALGVTEFPAMVYQSKKGRFVLPDNKMLEESAKIISFFEDVKTGKIERSLKSEPVPEKNDEPVKVVVGKNFESMVIQKEKDVMLEVYAPWCGHCKKLEPIYNEFAEKLKDNDHIVIAKMDGTANESPLEDFEWTGFPTLFFVKAGEKVPKKFDGERTLEGMVEYVKKHSTKGLENVKIDKSEEL